MSNPFKFSNGDNNRFKLLDEDNNGNFFNDKKKKEQKINNYNKENSFLRHNNIKKEKPVIEKSLNLEENFDKLFPEMIKTQSIDKISSSKMDFKNIVNKEEPEESLIQKNIIKPGTVVLKYENNKIISEYGELTSWEKQQENKLLYRETPYYIMTKAINTMEEYWNTYESIYDLMNGQYAYKDKYSMEPIYGTEYNIDEVDTDTDLDSNLDEDDDDYYY